ncbi:MAG: DNA polymerase III subunit chi [Gammaproteobacteria bacterium]|nr:DNA polymerase III subunit chi [Gammaproteobacteria bacterium]MCY4228154.1 DNA polymerase III subunit chi [Gammaproteobacteria bacterium]
MSRVDFYILDQEGPKGKFQFACRIVQKVRDLDLKVLVRTENMANSQTMDRMLWTFRQNSFIPHAIIQEGGLSWEDYPVQISHDFHCHDRANVLVNLKEDAGEQNLEYDRVVELVSNDLSDKDSGRARYRYYRDRGIEPLTHNIGRG